LVGQIVVLVGLVLRSRTPGPRYLAGRSHHDHTVTLHQLPDRW